MFGDPVDLELRYRHNYANICLSKHTRGESVGVRRKNGSTHYASWRGFIDRDTAKRIPGSRPVKLIIEEYRVMPDQWQKVPEGKFIQGCLVGNFAFAVVECAVRIV